MKIYIDFDDVICETCRSLCRIANQLFGTTVPYENVFAFDLDISFHLSRPQIKALMETAHQRNEILSFTETPNASNIIQSWIQMGHSVEIVTGRPVSTHDASCEWLALHNLSGIPVVHVDKFGREPPPSLGMPRSLSPAEFATHHYDFAVEDSPSAFPLLAKIPNCRVAVFSRPWNQSSTFPSPLFSRCPDWVSINSLL